MLENSSEVLPALSNRLPVSSEKYARRKSLDFQLRVWHGPVRRCKLNYHESLSIQIARKNGELVIEDIHSKGSIRVTTSHWITVSKPRFWTSLKGRPAGGYRRDDLYTVYQARSYTDLLKLVNQALKARSKPLIPLPVEKQVPIHDFFQLAKLAVDLKILVGCKSPEKKRRKTQPAPKSLNSRLAAIREELLRHI